MTAAELLRARDWSTTGLGPRSRWPAAVEHVVATVMESPLPLCYQHGPTLDMVYNDAFAHILGVKHPDVFGLPTREAVAEVWEQPNVGAAFLRVLETGESFLEHGVRLTLRRGRPTPYRLDDGYYTRAASPVRDDTGAVIGVLHMVLETTEGVERIRELAGLAGSLSVAATVDDVCKVALQHASLTLPVVEVLICLPEESGGGQSPGELRVTRHRLEDVVSPLEERLPLIWTALSGDERLVVQRALAGGGVAQHDDLVVVPMPTDGHMGAVVLRLERLDGPHDPLAADARTMLSSAAALVGQAIARAQLLDRERSTAELLQRALLPQLLPQSRSFALAGRYEPVATGAVAGGDFYDAFSIPDGRLVLVIGDVMGRGVAAATVMGQIRAGARGAAISDPEPDSVLSTLDEMVAGLDQLWPDAVSTGQSHDRAGRGFGGGFGGELFVTMLYGLLDTHTGELTLASAGHCPPALVPSARPGQAGTGPGPRPHIVDLVTGPPLGLGGPRPVQTIKLDVGEVLLTFTDGLLERRSSTLGDGERRLLEVLDAVSSDNPRSVCQAVLEAMAASGGFEDDCALLAVGRTSLEHRRATLMVPPLPEAVRPARDWARSQLMLWGIQEDAQFAVVTGLSELVTNVVLHAGTDAHVSLELDGSRLTCSVSDTGSRGLPTTASQGGSATRGRGLRLVQSISSAFGSHRTANGATVWFEVEVGATSPGDRWE
ncbi:SpoIIE family protein phosphatase [Knoellia sp. p5-6-4]|uniref:ATP-binding SpoIIE family protein phosphatase n=1 Tax=unclassified Knoellia TaxID=2618719 RepID=UPI0023DB3458|nr:SpoIIE family protein phosphatase [Knoellia sp. p5-6-4]MDF2143724.1 SpoIIE family protein phosphatase [Knoellia sp. p5-6-4]